MAESSRSHANEPTGDYVLLHRDTGTALYANRATGVQTIVNFFLLTLVQFSMSVDNRHG